MHTKFLQTAALAVMTASVIVAAVNHSLAGGKSYRDEWKEIPDIIILKSDSAPVFSYDELPSKHLHQFFQIK